MTFKIRGSSHQAHQFRLLLAKLLRKYGRMTVAELKLRTGATGALLHYHLNSGYEVDGARFFRAEEEAPSGRKTIYYSVTEAPPQPASEPTLSTLDDMATLAKAIGRLYRTGRRAEALAKAKEWQKLSDEIKKDAQ